MRPGSAVARAALLGAALWSSLAAAAFAGPPEARHLLGRATTAITTTDAGSRLNIRECARRMALLEVPARSEFHFLDALRLRGGVPDAPGLALVNGARVPSEGGGICQVAGTLYAAALQSGLGVVERAGHSAEVHSLPPGLDAAVSEEAGTDLVLWNGYDFPVQLELTVRGPLLEARWTASHPGVAARVARDGSGAVVRYLPDGREEVLAPAAPTR